MFQPSDVMKATGAGKTTVLRIEKELGIKPKRTALNYRIYTRGQAKRLVEAINKRRNRAAELAGVVGEKMKAPLGSDR